MLIINADDWGRSQRETDLTLACCLKGRITSVSGMVFMKDSERAAELAKQHDLDVGLHLNLGEDFTGQGMTEQHVRQHASIMRYLNSSRYALLFYNPFLRRQFRYDYEEQIKEFVRLYGRMPSHVDGHKHNHLSTNMLVGKIIPDGLKVRRSFTFFAGEKGPLNVAYRKKVNEHLARRFVVTDCFFSLNRSLKTGQIGRVAELAKTALVEIAAHADIDLEYQFLMGDNFEKTFNGVKLVPFSQV